jgi:hypothetical protein
MSSALFAYDGRFALHGTHVFTVVQGDLDIFKHVPRPIDTARPLSGNLDGIWKIGWPYNELPFMSLVPVHRPFYGPLFSRLSYDHRTIPIQRHPHGWSLKLEVMREWISLERNLRAIILAILEPERLTRLFRLWAWPTQYGYELHYRRCSDARIIALRSRDAFVPLMAAGTFALMYMYRNEKIEQNYSWRERVLQKTGIHHQWLADFEVSAVGDFLVPRVGGIIEMADCQYAELLPWLIQINMPLYLHWGITTTRPTTTTDYLDQAGLVPDHTHIRELQSRASRPSNTDTEHSQSTISSTPADDPTSSSTPPHAPTPPRDPTPRIFPPVERNSGQRPGEEWQAFFARRAQHNEIRAQNESSLDRDRRIRQEAHAATGQVPGKRGARVYFWDEVDGFLIRRAAGRANYDDYWERYGPNQRRYDSFRNEWDLCAAFDPHDEPMFDNDDDDDPDNDDYFDSANPPLLDAIDVPDHNEGVYSSGADLQRIYGRQESDDQTLSSEDQIDDLAYHRFGFYCSWDVTTNREDLRWDTIAKILGHGWVEGRVNPRQSAKDSMSSFLSSLVRARLLTDVPAHLYDLRQTDAEIHRQTTIRVRSERFDNKAYYFIAPRTSEGANARMELVLPSAASVLEIMRRHWGPDLTLIMHQLLDRGIPFNTCIPDRPPPTRILPLRPVSRYNGLGYRPPKYTPDKVDYAAYESIRDQFLTSARGRAAMLMGGIVARLAREVVTYENVSYGPSDDVVGNGLCLWDGHQSSPAYWDDRLTEDEVNVICGVYKVDTGEFRFIKVIREELT